MFLMEIEHFQNQMLIQAHNIQDLRHNISSAEKRVRERIMANPVASDHRHAEDGIKERVDLTGSFIPEN